MKKIKIFCEGITDQVFIADCLESFYEYSSHRKGRTKNGHEKIDLVINENIEVIEVGGCDKLSDQLYLSMLEDNTSNGGQNIVIFDADDFIRGNGNKGFKACKQKLEFLKKKKKVEFDYYIWPNNKDEGMIEDLLRKLICKDKEPIYDCIESHQDCLSKLIYEGVEIKKAELKDKVGFYLYTVNLDSKASKRNYKNNLFWDLNHEKIEDLNSFKEFMDKLL